MTSLYKFEKYIKDDPLTLVEVHFFEENGGPVYNTRATVYTVRLDGTQKIDIYYGDIDSLWVLWTINDEQNRDALDRAYSYFGNDKLNEMFLAIAGM
jgi:hypothetical protein